jgi:hypothetical protein
MLAALSTGAPPLPVRTSTSLDGCPEDVRVAAIVIAAICPNETTADGLAARSPAERFGRARS